jgi:cytochrome c553
MSERAADRVVAFRTALLRATALLSCLVAAACTGGGEKGGAPDVAGTVHVCSSCHGPGGRSDNSTFPRLAGQQKEYLVMQLKAFRDKTRADPHAHTYMWGMAAHLSDATIDGLADYYASQPPVAGTSGNPADISAGDVIFHNGIEAESVPACMACHGEKADGNGVFPRLAGQHQSYLERQLEAFQIQSRANEIMHENSKNLTAGEISQVTAFLAAQ